MFFLQTKGYYKLTLTPIRKERDWGVRPVLSCGEEKKGYTLNGEISDVKDGMVYLKKYQDKSFIAVDSAVITDLRCWCTEDVLLRCMIFPMTFLITIS